MNINSPFPPLERWPEMNQWAGTISLPSLAGCYVKWAWSPDDFFSSSRAKETRGRSAELTINNEDAQGPDAAQRNAMQHLLANEGAIANRLLATLQTDLLSDLPDLTYSVGWKPDELVQRDQFLETVKHGNGIRELVSLASVVVYKRNLWDFSYLSFTFEKGWDGEHGFMVIMHQDRIIDSGDPGFLYSFEQSSFYENEGEPVYGDYG